jgi:acyl transferase domain-containing protein
MHAQVSHAGMHAPTGDRIMVVETCAIRQQAQGRSLAAESGTPAAESSSLDGASLALPPSPPVLVLRATCRVRSPPTAFVFTGQGSAAKGMGMDLYASSAVARRVWDEADAHLSKVRQTRASHARPLC